MSNLVSYKRAITILLPLAHISLTGIKHLANVDFNQILIIQVPSI